MKKIQDDLLANKVFSYVHSNVLCVRLREFLISCMIKLSTTFSCICSKENILLMLTSKVQYSRIVYLSHTYS